MRAGSEVSVVGAGVIAKSVALALARSGARVAIFAPTGLAARSASRASGAMLGAFAEYTKDKDTRADRAEGVLREAAGLRWQSWYDELADGTPAAGRVRRGTFIVASNNGLADVDNIEFIKSRADASGQRSEWIDARDVPGLEPHRLSRPLRVLALPDEGYIESGTVLAALDAALERHPSVLVVDDAVESVSLSGPRPVVRTRRGEDHPADRVVVAAGADTCGLLRDLELGGTPLPAMLGGRGASLVVETDVRFGGVIRTPNRDFACGTHVVPMAGGRAYLGATNRLETSSFDRPQLSLGELHSLSHSLANEVNVWLRTASVVETRAGYRPIASDGYPLFGRAGGSDVFVATATYRNGMLMAPEIADTVAREVLGLEAVQDNPFAPEARDGLFADRDVTATMLASLRQVVSFVQEPDGNLPFDRAAELESLLAAFLSAALGLEHGRDVLERYERLTRQYPISEAMPLLMYEIAGAARPAAAVAAHG
ncbi:FAD-dependent oxidoreductase [Isoptericola sp. G70]|uniref:FAD-dependent oxidoreductase n=1 Tax=Isoptericola sp. G70 TaxID=3376633 RepID=UPI003A813B31